MCRLNWRTEVILERFFNFFVLVLFLVVGQLSLAGPRGDCDPLIFSVARLEAAKSTSQLRKAMLDMGVELNDISRFFNKETVQFNYPTTGGDPTYGFLKYEQGKLTAQLFSISTESTFGALDSFSRFREQSVQFADLLGVPKLELQGGSVFNQSIRKFLQKHGFEPKEVPIPKKLGKGTQTVYFKVLDVYVAE